MAEPSARERELAEQIDHNSSGSSRARRGWWGMGDQRDGGISWTDQTRRCSACKTTHPLSEFGRDADQRDGLATKCLSSRRVKTRKPRTSFKAHGWLKPARDGDKKQARRRVNYLVEQRRIPHPDELPCMDCGHRADDLRHEYDHARGYAAEHQLYVEPVCSRCHHSREAARRG